MSTVHPLIILGSGPAGCTAAIYAARAGLSPLLIQGPEPGGQLTITKDVENFPGFLAIEGPDLMKHMREHAQHAGTHLVTDTITDVQFSANQDPHKLFARDKLYQASAVILATGASAKWLGLESEKAFRGFGVSACATCDGPLFKKKVVAVVGGGNTAVEEALFLTNHAKKVILIHRRDTLRAEHVLQKRLKAHPDIEILWNHVVEDVKGQEKPMKTITHLALKNTKSGHVSDLPIQGLFIAIGHTPNTGFLKGHIALDSEGYVVGTTPGTHTEIPGVFTAGDVRDKVYRQAITAAGQGCMAALDAERYLRSRA